MSLEMRTDTEISDKSKSNIWKYFTKERGQDNKITAKCNYCNAKYAVVKGATTNLWTHIKKIHVSLFDLSTTQRTLEQYGLSVNSNSEIFTGASTEENLRKWLTNWIILEDLPFTIVEGWLKWILKKVTGGFHLETSGKLSLSLDIWTSTVVKSYMEITVHFIDNSWHLQQITLDFIELEGSHTGKNIAEELIMINSITTDNASNNDTMFSYLELWAKDNDIDFSGNNQQCRCFAHVVNLAVQAALKELKPEIDKIRNLIVKSRSLSQRRKKFSEISKLNGVDDLLPILDVPTRWNSTYDMVKRALDLKVVFDKIILANEFSDLNSIKLSQSDWTSLENIAAFLRCFAKLSTEMCASTYPTISAVYPMYNLLMGHAEKKMNKDKTPNNIALAANAAWNKLYEYYNKASEETHYIATILDPRWKIKYFKDWEDEENGDENMYYKNAKKIFTRKFDEYRSIYYPVSGMLNNSSGENEDSEDSLFPVPKRFRNNNGHDELNSYFNSTPEPGTINVLEWWKSHKSNYPTLVKMARNYLAIPATSAPVERLFSESGNLITPERNRLRSDIIHAIMCLKSWLTIPNITNQ
ncbi:zinc finger BED domain-containing protein RICESLEEPER 2-like [Rhizophagus irregularis DAOM 181602=DAOM 197198]|nr:zinc finger BED domain-containing protein RICESLEEPER 2-like [Rhizophagus irregularis DAOM 181602=DAOM 197198]